MSSPWPKKLGSAPTSNAFTVPTRRCVKMNAPCVAMGQPYFWYITSWVPSPRTDIIVVSPDAAPP